MECLFCRIANKEIPAKIIFEDENFVAFLDINPRSTGMSLVVPKKHLVSLTEDLDFSKKMFEIAINVSEAIKKALSPIAISIAYFPSKMEHIHLRIYPYYENEFPLVENKPKEVNDEELQRIAEAIRSALEIESTKKIEKSKIEEKKEEKQEKEIKETGKKEISRRKRDWLIA